MTRLPLGEITSENEQRRRSPSRAKRRAPWRAHSSWGKAALAVYCSCDGSLSDFFLFPDCSRTSGLESSLNQVHLRIHHALKETSYLTDSVSFPPFTTIATRIGNYLSRTPPSPPQAPFPRRGSAGQREWFSCFDSTRRNASATRPVINQAPQEEESPALAARGDVRATLAGAGQLGDSRMAL
jgi:hypothetical protein